MQRALTTSLLLVALVMLGAAGSVSLADNPAQEPDITETPTLTPTPPLATLTPVAAPDLPEPIDPNAAPITASFGWSCNEYPCENDIDGFMNRVRVPRGFELAYVGKFPGAPQQITYGQDGRLYATVLEGGTQSGAVYAMFDNGALARYAGDFFMPVGLAFQPGTDVLYVSGRVTLEQGGGLWRVPPRGGFQPELVIGDLPCCFDTLTNQPNGMVFGPDGYLYLGVGALTDHGESPRPQVQSFADIDPLEASVLRIQPHTGEVGVFAAGLRNPYDLTFDTRGQFYATDQGMLSGIGNRVVPLRDGAHLGFPYWGLRGCEGCPSRPPSLEVTPDLLRLPNGSLPRGIAAYTGAQFPANYRNDLFVVLWSGIAEDSQRVLHIDVERLTEEGYTPQPFVTGLIRPTDVIVAPDGTLVVVDFVYGHVWRVRYRG